MMLEPGHRFGVQVVGGLVEQQHVGLGEQQAGERHAPALAARELGHLQIVRRAAQGVHGHLDAQVDVPEIAGVDLLLEGGHLLHERVAVVFAELGRHSVIGVENLLLLAPGDDVAPHIERRIEMGFLLQVAPAHAVGRPGLAVELGIEPGHDLEQGRLARAVDADHADLGVGVERQPDVLEHLLAAGIGLRQTLHLKDVLRGHAPSGGGNGWLSGTRRT